ncbi:MAG: translation initiation factor IF-2 [Thermoplasmata archaeon]
MKIRQPIVSVLGHVDHGKTTVLDKIRGTSIAEREAGRITQHIGATEVPIDEIHKICSILIGDKGFKIPGLLFIDTPGHHAFTTLRARGGSLADIAILVIDISEGLKPQTIESINILKRFKTPFVIAANKIDRIMGWIPQKGAPFVHSLQSQNEEAKEALDKKLYEIVGVLFDMGFSAERYDRISDFTKNVAIVPISAKFEEGFPDLLMVLCGLAQKFLETRLHTENKPAEGTVLEVKDERGFGTTIDAIIYNGTIKQGDTIVVGGLNGAVVTKVKALLKPKPLHEIRDPSQKFTSVKKANAAAGLKITANNLDDVVAGALLKVAADDLEKTKTEVEVSSKPSIETEDNGIIIKADAIGSLEALSFELKEKQTPIKKVDIGNISKRDVVEASTISDPLRRVILGFNVKILPDAGEELGKSDVTVFVNDTIYKLIEDYEAWLVKKSMELEKTSREEIVYPVKIKILSGCVFRVSNPAIVGVRVLAGKLRAGCRLIRDDGKYIGKMESIQIKNESVKEAAMGSEVAVAIDGPTVGRQIHENDVLYVEIPEIDAKKLNEMDISIEEKDVLNEIFKIKRREKQFWGM